MLPPFKKLYMLLKHPYDLLAYIENQMLPDSDPMINFGF